MARTGRYLRALAVPVVCLVLSSQALGVEKYQTNIGPTPLDGSNRANVLGRGSVQAILDGTRFTVQGSFAGLATPATEAHLCMGMVMGGMGPVIGDVFVTRANDGKISGTVTLTGEQIAGLKSGKIYVLLSSQNATKGNLWGWFQPAHKTVGPDVPQQRSWYIPNILLDDTSISRKKPQG